MSKNTTIIRQSKNMIYNYGWLFLKFKKRGEKMKVKLNLTSDSLWGKFKLWFIFFVNKKEIKKEMRKINLKNIPDAKNWRPPECFYQNPDFSDPIGGIDGDGVTICVSQLYEKPDRDLVALRDEYKMLISKFVPEEIVFIEIHVSTQNGRSYFLEK